MAPRLRRQRVMGLPTSRTSLSLNTSSFLSTHQDILSGYNTVAENDAGSNQDLSISTIATTSKLSTSNSNILNSSQSMTSPNQASLTPSTSLEDFTSDDPFGNFNYGEFWGDPVSPFPIEKSEKNSLPTDPGMNITNPIADALDRSTQSYKAALLHPWIQTWPTKDLDDKSWSDIVSSKALSLPEWKVIEYLLRLYFQFLNPLLPVLKERDLYSLINPGVQGDGVATKPISLALLNAIMFAASSFVLKGYALSAGFPSIRSMSSAFFTRAKILYDLGCEDTVIGRTQICLLLSYRKTYNDPTSFESEHFLSEAALHLEKADLPTSIVSSQHPPTQESNMWRRLYVSWALRMIYITLGTRRATVLKRLISIKLPKIEISALDDDINFSWFLDTKTKQLLAQIFIANVALVSRILPLCSFLMSKSSDTISSGDPQTSKAGKSILALTGEVENMLAEWSNEYAQLFEPISSLADMDNDNRSAFLVKQSFLKLTYEYCVSTLHQINLIHDTASSKWGVRMKQLSREALWESVCSTTRTLEDLLSKGVIRYLPISALQCILIPFTCNNLFVKIAIKCNAVSIEGLSICARSFRVLAERYDAADFYMDILNESLEITHGMMLEAGPDNEHDKRAEMVDLRGIVEIPLPPADIYSYVIRFQEVSFATGSVAKGKRA